MTRNLNLLFISIALFALSASSLGAQNSLLYPGTAAGRDSLRMKAAADSLRKAALDTAAAPVMRDESIITRFTKGTGAPVDTLDFGDGRVQVVLKDDGTWCFIKNLKSLEENDLFSRNWRTNLVNPYNVPIDSIPYRTTICLVDSVSSFVCPHQGKVFSKFGIRHRRNHTGCDVPYPVGTPVHAAFDGCIRLAEYHKGYGNLVIIRHENGLETLYGHLSKINVEVGQWVHAGDVIGLGGSTGRSSGPHLHFETRVRGYAFDPEWIVDFENGKLRTNVFVLKRSYLSITSKYVPQNLDEEEEIYMTDEQIKAEEERIAKEKAAAKYHTIKSGDTLSHLASKYGTSVNKICSLNPGLKPTTVLSLGRKVRVK